MVAEPGRLIRVVGTIESIVLACALLRVFSIASHSLHSRVLRRGSCDGMAPPQLRRLRSARHVGLGPGEGLTPVVEYVDANARTYRWAPQIQRRGRIDGINENQRA